MLTKYIKPFFIVLILLVFIFLFKDINTYASSNIDLSEYYCKTDTIYDLRDVSNINPLLDEDNNEITVDEYTDKLLGSNVSGNNSRM